MSAAEDVRVAIGGWFPGWHAWQARRCWHARLEGSYAAVQGEPDRRYARARRPDILVILIAAQDRAVRCQAPGDGGGDSRPRPRPLPVDVMAAMLARGEPDLVALTAMLTAPP